MLRTAIALAALTITPAIRAQVAPATKPKHLTPQEQRQFRQEEKCFNDASLMPGVMYKLQGIAEGKCEWVVDREVMDQEAKEEQHKKDLAWWLISRPLNQAEMEEVRGYGSQLYVHGSQQYFQADIDREFMQAMLVQFQIQADSHRTCKGDQ